MLIENREPNVKNLGDFVTLIPGVNEVDPAKWEQASKIALVQHFVKRGTLVVVSGGSESHKDIGALDEREAIDLVGRTVDEKLLRSFADNDQRPVVRDAVDKQLHAISPQPPAKKGK